MVKCEVPVRGINARRRVICEAGMCEVQRTTGAAGVVIGCEPLSVTNYLIGQSQMLRLGVTGTVRSEFAWCSYGRRRIAR